MLLACVLLACVLLACVLYMFDEMGIAGARAASATASVLALLPCVRRFCAVRWHSTPCGQVRSSYLLLHHCYCTCTAAFFARPLQHLHGFAHRFARRCLGAIGQPSADGLH